ncbi:MAG TPA: GNAT family N-acetyltransferase, partial [Acidimicrobiia bacterium]|nr:GNAT family N-acetyltransferase [Acidimicrobiia bacterium]
MTFTVRPCANLDEFGRAVLGVGQYFGMELDEERMERFSRNLPLGRMHAAFEGSRIVGGAGAFPFEMTLPGGTVRTAGV